jgi:hypothetical protein
MPARRGPPDFHALRSKHGCREALMAIDLLGLDGADALPPPQPLSPPPPPMSLSPLGHIVGGKAGGRFGLIIRSM